MGSCFLVASVILSWLLEGGSFNPAKTKLQIFLAFYFKKFEYTYSLFQVFIKMDPFKNDAFERLSKSKIHIRVQQRNGRKCITTIAGLEDDLDTKRICKAMKAAFNCNGNVVESKEDGDVIQLQGDQRDNSREWLLSMEIIGKEEKDRIVVHGF